MKILFTAIRHGKTTANEMGLISGGLEYELSNDGRLELQKIKEEKLYGDSEVYYVSPRKRAIQTFDILFEGKDKIILNDLQEINYGYVDGKRYDRLDEFYAKFFKREKENLDYENYYELEGRLKRVLKYIYNECEKNNHSSVTIVAHYGIIRMFYHFSNKLSVREYRSLRIKNGRGYVFELSKEGEDIIINYLKKV